MAGPNTATRKKLAQQGKAIAGGGSGGRFPIRSGDDLGKAIQAVGRAAGGEPGRRKVRRFIIKRAQALGLSSKIPSNWAPDGSLKA